MSSTPSPILPPKPKAYPLYFGGLAAAFAAACTHPLDLTKVRLQTSKSTGVIATLTDSVRHDGIVKGAFAGLSASILRAMTYSLTRFGVYAAMKGKLEDRRRAQTGSSALKPWEIASLASVAGGLGGVAGNPADIVLVRMTGDATKPPELRLNYRNCFDGLYRVVKDEGVSSLFRGLAPNVVRAVLMNASQLATYDLFKEAILKRDLMNDGLGVHFVCSFLAGTVATTICSPADVLKSRIMGAKGSDGVAAVITKSFKNEGFRWLFKGWLPAWIRLSPNTILVFMSLEQLKVFYDSYVR